MSRPSLHYSSRLVSLSCYKTWKELRRSGASTSSPNSRGRYDRWREGDLLYVWYLHNRLQYDVSLTSNDLFWEHSKRSLSRYCDVHPGPACQCWDTVQVLREIQNSHRCNRVALVHDSIPPGGAVIFGARLTTLSQLDSYIDKVANGTGIGKFGAFVDRVLHG